MDQLGQSLAVRTEISVVANGTLVSVSHNIFTLVGAKRAVTEDSNMMLVASGLVGHWLVQRD